MLSTVVENTYVPASCSAQVSCKLKSPVIKVVLWIVNVPAPDPPGAAKITTLLSVSSVERGNVVKSMKTVCLVPSNVTGNSIFPLGPSTLNSAVLFKVPVTWNSSLVNELKSPSR